MKIGSKKGLWASEGGQINELWVEFDLSELDSLALQNCQYV